MTWRRIAGFRRVTADIDRATRFYAALGFHPEGRRPIGPDEIAALGLTGSGTRQPLRLGRDRLDLDAFDPPGRAYPPGADAAALLFQHLALATGDAAEAWAVARSAGAAPISRDGPVALPASVGGATAVKFRDPDGHPLELLASAGRTADGGPGAGLLGIDHSAISVSDLAASRRFYAAQGLAEGRPSLNSGPTQVALDGLGGAEVDVVPLRPPEAPPHLELLGYRHPRGRSYGPVAPNDVAATRVVWAAGRSALVRDPDGHLHQQEP